MTSSAKSAKRVYFLRPIGADGPIKIGCSAIPDDRLKLIAEWSPLPLEVAASAPGSFDNENMLHRAFAPERLHGEWFRVTPALTALIDEVARTGKLPSIPDDERATYMAQLYLDGKTLQQIGDRFALTRERVRQILRKEGVPSLGLRAAHARKAAPLTDQERAIAASYRDGVRPLAILKQFGVTNSELQMALARAKVRRPGPGKWNRRSDYDDILNGVAQAYAAGEKTAAIAAKFGLTQPGIYIWLNRAGITPARGRGRKRGAHSLTAQQAAA